jgi:hypothetical protein
LKCQGKPYEDRTEGSSRRWPRYTRLGTVRIFVVPGRTVGQGFAGKIKAAKLQNVFAVNNHCNLNNLTSLLGVRLAHGCIHYATPRSPAQRDAQACYLTAVIYFRASAQG